MYFIEDYVLPVLMYALEAVDLPPKQIHGLTVYLSTMHRHIIITCSGEEAPGGLIAFPVLRLC